MVRAGNKLTRSGTAPSAHGKVVDHRSLIPFSPTVTKVL